MSDNITPLFPPNWWKCNCGGIIYHVVKRADAHYIECAMCGQHQHEFTVYYEFKE